MSNCTPTEVIITDSGETKVIIPYNGESVLFLRGQKTLVMSWCSVGGDVVSLTANNQTEYTDDIRCAIQHIEADLNEMSASKFEENYKLQLAWDRNTKNKMGACPNTQFEAITNRVSDQMDTYYMESGAYYDTPAEERNIVVLTTPIGFSRYD